MPSRNKLLAFTPPKAKRTSSTQASSGNRNEVGGAMLTWTVGSMFAQNTQQKWLKQQRHKKAVREAFQYKRFSARVVSTPFPSFWESQYGSVERDSHVGLVDDDLVPFFKGVWEGGLDFASKCDVAGFARKRVPELAGTLMGNVEIPHVRSVMEKVRATIQNRAARIKLWQKEGPYCKWAGVICDGAGQVLSVVFSPSFGQLNMTAMSPLLASLGTLGSLSLKGAHFREFPQEVVQITSLVRLGVSFDDLTHMPVIAPGLHTLKYLSLFLPKVVHIAPSFGQHLPSLLELRISVAHRRKASANTYEVGARTLAGLGTLRVLELNLRESTGPTLPADIHTQVPRLAVLILTVPWLELPPGFAQLHELAFIQVDITTIVMRTDHGEAFPSDLRMPKLVHFNLVTNKQRFAFPEGLCHSAKLRYLHMHLRTVPLEGSHGILTSLPPVCGPFRSLRSLFLVAEGVPAFHPWMFNEMPELYSLMIGGSQTRSTSLPRVIGRGLPKLELFNIYLPAGTGSVPFPEFDPDTDARANGRPTMLDTLKYFACSWSEVDSLPSFANATSIIAMSVQRGVPGKLTAFPTLPSRSPYFRLLLAAYTGLEEVSTDFCNCTALTIVDLNGNQLQTLPNCLDRLKNLKVFELGNNHLTRLPPTFTKLVALERARIFNNRLVTLPSSMRDMTQLQRLEVYNNRLTHLNYDFTTMKSLQFILAANNQITEFPRFLVEAISTSVKFWKADLCGNQIDSIPPSLFLAQPMHGSKQWHFLIDMKSMLAAGLHRDNVTLSDWSNLLEQSRDFYRGLDGTAAPMAPVVDANRRKKGGPNVMEHTLLEYVGYIWARRLNDGQMLDFEFIGGEFRRITDKVFRRMNIVTGFQYFNKDRYSITLQPMNDDSLGGAVLDLMGCNRGSFQLPDGTCVFCPLVGRCLPDRVQCPQGFLFRLEDRAASCDLCPSGAVCTGDHIAHPLPGFWKPPAGKTDTVYKCRVQAACLGDPAGLRGVYAAHHTPNKRVSYAYGYPGGGNHTDTDKQGCGVGYSGPLCDVCTPGYYHTRSGSGMGCTRCPSVYMSVFWVTSIWGAVCAFFFATIYIGVQGQNHIGVAGERPTWTPDDEMRAVRASLVKITIGFLQTLALVVTSYKVEWPESLTSMSKSLHWTNLNFMKTSSVECLVEHNGLSRLTYYDYLVFGLCVPLGIIFVTVTLYLVFYLVRTKSTLLRHTKFERIPVSAVQSFCVRMVVTLLLLTYLPVSSRAVRFFGCQTFGGQVQYLSTDLSVECYNRQWYASLPVVCMVLFVYTLCFPLLILLHPFVVPKRFHYYFDVVQESYRKGFRWWESLELLRKVLIGAVVGLLPGATLFDLTISLMISFVALFVHLLTLPFCSGLVNHMQTVSLTMTYLTLFLGVLKPLKMPHGQYSVFALVVVVLDVVLIVAMVGLAFSALGGYALAKVRKSATELTKTVRGTRAV